MTEPLDAHRCYLSGIAYYLPDRVSDTEDLCRLNPDWEAERIFQKTGIRSRHIVSESESASVIGCEAARQLFVRTGFNPADIDVLIVGSQCPDFVLPGNAHVLHAALGLSKRCAAFDVTLGCSGFVYGLWLARSLIISGSARHVLLISTDTYSRYCDQSDLATVSLFGDGAAAVLLTANKRNSLAEIGHSVLFSDGAGVSSLTVAEGGCDTLRRDLAAGMSPRPTLKMNGPDVFSFALREIGPAVNQLLDECGLSLPEIDLFLLHQANAFMLDHIRRKLGVTAEKLPVDVEFTGNTVNASIPILIARLREQGRLEDPKCCVLVGFGVGLSWGATLMHWHGVNCDLET